MLRRVVKVLIGHEGRVMGADHIPSSLNGHHYVGLQLWRVHTSVYLGSWAVPCTLDGSFSTVIWGLGGSVGFWGVHNVIRTSCHKGNLVTRFPGDVVSPSRGALRVALACLLGSVAYDRTLKFWSTQGKAEPPVDPSSFK
eukprot:2807692-Amphidinium_carterae.1